MASSEEARRIAAKHRQAAGAAETAALFRTGARVRHALVVIIASDFNYAGIVASWGRALWPDPQG